MTQKKKETTSQTNNPDRVKFSNKVSERQKQIKTTGTRKMAKKAAKKK